MWHFYTRIIIWPTIQVLRTILRSIRWCYERCNHKQKYLLDRIYFFLPSLQSIFRYRLGYTNQVNSLSSISFPIKAMELGWILGIQIQIIEIQTKDGYILNLFRCKDIFFTSSSLSSKAPILIIPGLIQNADLLLSIDSPNNIVQILVKKGYEVWIGNNRGTKYSFRHTTFRESNSAYWNYSLDELVKIDLKSLMLAVKQYSNHEKMICISFGYASLQVMSLLATCSFIDSSVLLYISLSPCLDICSQVKMKTKTTTTTTMNTNTTKMNHLSTPSYGQHITLSYFILSRYFQYFQFQSKISTLFDEIKLIFSPKVVESIILRLVKGYFDWDLTKIKKNKLTRYLEYINTITSSKLFCHVLDVQMNHQLHWYNYDNNHDGDHHQINLSKITCPVAIVSGANDSDMERLKFLSNALKNCIHSELIPNYNYFDLMWSDTTRVDVYSNILDLIDQCQIE